MNVYINLCVRVFVLIYICVVRLKGSKGLENSALFYSGLPSEEMDHPQWRLY